MSGVRQTKVIGYSVQGRPITAFELGNPKAPTKDLVLGSMHGYYERAGEQVVASLKSMAIPNNLDLWVISTINPDGDAMGQRANAHNVDLNRDWPNLWQHIVGNPSDKFDNHGNCSCGPLSQPETRAMHSFLQWLKPTRMVSLHQPLDGVDTTDGGAKDAAFRDALAENLSLPEKALTCFGGCHGSMTGWLTNYTTTTGVTVEFGSSPSSSYLRGQAARGVLAALLIGVKPLPKPIAKVTGHLDKVSTAVGTIRVAGWSLDPARPAASNYVVITVDGRAAVRSAAASVRADVDRVMNVSGRHGFSWQVKAGPGRHTVCATGLAASNTGSATAALVGSCRAVVVPQPAMAGHVDKVTVTPTSTGGSVRVVGWAVDPKVLPKYRQQRVEIAVDGKGVARVGTTVPRPDVNRIMGGVHGHYGFTRTVSVTPGRHIITVTALATSSGTRATVLFRKTVTVPTP